MPENQKSINVVAYARASCKQNESSVDDQLDQIRDWIAAQKLLWKIVIAYRGD